MAESLRGRALLQALEAVPLRERDALADALLGVPAAAEDLPALPPGAVPYLPCGVDSILRAVREAPIQASDVFVDLGAGLGRVALLVNLLTGARALGVELQPHLVDRARMASAALGVREVSFICGDAASDDAWAQLQDANAFFIYSSFGREALSRVLAQLERAARRRRITLCAVDFEVHDQPWLTARPSQSPELVFYDSVPRD